MRRNGLKIEFEYQRASWASLIIPQPKDKFDKICSKLLKILDKIDDKNL